MKESNRPKKIKDAEMLNERFRRIIKVFGEDTAKKRSWICFEDFRKSVNKYYDIAGIWFDGEGYLTLKYAKALLAFHEALNEFCKFSEDNNIEDLQVIRESPHFHKVEQRARDFLAITDRSGRG